ncbi:unnamed protein product [Cochlearia groenlandica]
MLVVVVTVSVVAAAFRCRSEAETTGRDGDRDRKLGNCQERLAERFSVVAVTDSCGSHENEDVEATIKQQVEENNVLKSELQIRYLWLAKYVSSF